MSVLSILLISVGLAMDCFAVSIGLGTKRLDKLKEDDLENSVLKERFSLGLKLGFVFGLFQAGMTLLGWLLGAGFRDLVSDYDHWIAFAILSIVGVKMILEASHPKDEGPCELNYMEKGIQTSASKKARREQEKKEGGIKKKTLVLLALATSIDALAIGLSFAFLKIQILKTAILIGFTSFIFSFLGVEIGHRLGCYIKNRAELFGGVILIVLGLKILIEHLYF